MGCAVASAMFLSPGGHQAKNGAKAFTMSRERILDAWRHLSVYLAADDFVALEFAQLLGEHFLGGSRKEPLQFAEAADAALKVVEDGRLPLSADDVGGDFNGTIEGIHTRFAPDTRYQKGAY
jgi:hypothetical protein